MVNSVRFVDEFWSFGAYGDETGDEFQVTAYDGVETVLLLDLSDAA